MHIRYPIESKPDHQSFEFDSLGSKGRIKKVVLYTQLKELNENIYNLSFGDWDESSQEINYEVNSNNGDGKMVLATVALTALEFSKHFPEAIIHIKGSTSSRTRLYQMGINSYFMEINELFHIIGFKNSAWEIFEPNRNYEAFVIKRK